MREEVVGHDFRKRKLLTQTHHIQNFASQSGLRPPHHGHDFRKRKLPLATAPSCAVSRSKHFATQNGLRPPRFLRGAYFAVHWFNLNFIKIILANDFLDNITFKFCINLNSRHFQNCVKTEQYSCEDFMVMTFALQNCRLAERYTLSLSHNSNTFRIFRFMLYYIK